MYIEMFVVMKHVYILYYIKYINKNYKHINEYITYTCDITGRYMSAPEWAGVNGSLLKDPTQWYFRTARTGTWTQVVGVPDRDYNY